MIDFAQKNNGTAYTNEEINEKFLELMPKIIKIAKHAFKEYDADRKEDAVQSVLVTAFHNVKLLAEQGRLDDAFATPIAWYAVKAHKCGRIGGVPQNSTDVFGERCRWLGRSTIKNYGLATEITDSFESEATAADARYPVHKTVQLKMDFFENWFRQQTPRDQEAMKMLAIGEATGDVAKHFGVSPGAVSQWRRRFADSWFAFINPAEETDFIEELRTLAAESEMVVTN